MRGYIEYATLFENNPTKGLTTKREPKCRGKPMQSDVPFPELLREKEPILARARTKDREDKPGARVYFIQENGTNAIKIGVSKNAQKRAKELQINMPGEVMLLATVEGGHYVEGLLHSLFAHAHIRGEWFRPVEELIAYIAREGELPEVTKKRDLEELFAKRRAIRILA